MKTIMIISGLLIITAPWLIVAYGIIRLMIELQRTWTDFDQPTKREFLHEEGE